MRIVLNESQVQPLAEVLAAVEPGVSVEVEQVVGGVLLHAVVVSVEGDASSEVVAHDGRRGQLAPE